MKKTANKLLALALCVLVLGAMSVPVWAANEHCDQVLGIDIQRTGEVTDWGNEILLFTVVTTPAVKALYFCNGRFEPYTTDLEQIGTTPEGNLIWRQTRVSGEGRPVMEVCWDDEHGERVVEWQAFDYSEPTPAPQPAENLCRWCGHSHGGGFDAIKARFHKLFVQLFGARY